jgi:hypothetical protein
MKLTGTLTGAQRRAAVIDGAVFAEGAFVRPGGGAQAIANGSTASATATATAAQTASNAGASSSQRVEFRLARVEHRSAVLQRNGKSYTLVMELPNVSGTDFEVLAPQTPN